jgi:hypothetical protein
MTLVHSLRRQPLLGYFALAYGISWSGILVVLSFRLQSDEVAAAGHGPHLRSDVVGPEHRWTGKHRTDGRPTGAARTPVEPGALAGSRALVRGHPRDAKEYGRRT